MIISLLDAPTKIDLPNSLISWMGLGVFSLLFFVLLIHWWDLPVKVLQQKWKLLIFLTLMVVPANLFMGFGSSPFAGDSLIGGLKTGMFFSAIPWILVSAFFGPVLGGLVGLLGGLMQTLWLSHSIYSTFVIAISGILAGVAFHQKYRGSIYDALRHPAGAAAIAVVTAYLLSAGGAFLGQDGSMAARLDASLKTWRADFLPLVLPILIAGMVVEILYRNKIGPWRNRNNLLPSPDEGFSDSKFWRISLPVCLIFIFLFSQANWSIQTRQLGNFLQNSIVSHAEFTAGYWVTEMDSFTEKTANFVNPGLLELSPLEFFLASQKQFKDENLQISLINSKAIVLNQYPDNDASIQFPAEIINAIRTALKGENSGVLGLHTGNDPQVFTLVSVTSIRSSDGSPAGAVLFQKKAGGTGERSGFWNEVLKIEELGGEVWVLPAEGYQQKIGDIDSEEIQSRVFPGEFISYQAGAIDAQYGYWPASPDWNVFVKISSTAASQSLLPEFIKQSLLLIIGFTILLLLLNLYWLNLYRDEQRLLQGSRQISRGDYSPLDGMQEIAEMTDLAVAMEQIRVNVKSQMDEARRLISIGRGVAFREEFGSAVEPILRAALRGDAACARIILVPPAIESVLQSPPRRFGLGERSEAYAVLDNQILEICKREGIFVIRNTARSRRIDLNSAVTVPSSIVGLPIFLEKDDFLGVFWIGYDKPQVFPDEEISHLKTLSSEIAVAAAGERRLSETEQGKKQFEALLGSIQDPLLLLDVSGEVVFTNEAASNLDGLIVFDEEGRRVAALPALNKSINGVSLDLMDEGLLRELVLPDGRVYSARFTPFKTDGQFSGSLCVLRDVNSYSEMISRKGEFVETVSHDLRQPLTMISGYATMIHMVGSVNEQQKNYLQKIDNDIETMKKMVNSILDLGRIETDTRLKLEEIDPEELVAQIVDETNPQANQKKINLSDLTERRGKSLLVEADAELLHQALVNVVENAIKFTNMNGKVEFWVENGSEICVFHIRDNGIGISPIDLPGIFNKNPRASNREAGQRASKLGLTIVKSIVELHNGNVTVESQLGKGSHFRIEIPNRH